MSCLHFAVSLKWLFIIALGLSPFALLGTGRTQRSQMIFLAPAFSFFFLIVFFFDAGSVLLCYTYRNWRISKSVCFNLCLATNSTRWLKRKWDVLFDIFPSCHALCYSASYAWRMHKWIMWSYETVKPVHLYDYFSKNDIHKVTRQVFPTVNVFISCTHSSSHILK